MTAEANKNKTLLLVDDQPTNLKVLIDTLNEAGYHTLIADSGNRALYQTAHHPPDLILLDVMMPGLDGFETCLRLKASPDTAKIPVIFITALTDVDSKIKGFEAGAVDYITKPFQQVEVLARVKTHLSNYTLQQQLAAKNRQLQDKNSQLEAALKQVKQLSGMLPICSGCKKIRDDEGYWEDVADYIRDHSEAEFTHGLCPNCARTLYPEFYSG